MVLVRTKRKELLCKQRTDEYMRKRRLFVRMKNISQFEFGNLIKIVVDKQLAPF